jgi:hypothetical protein
MTDPELVVGADDTVDAIVRAVPELAGYLDPGGANGNAAPCRPISVGVDDNTITVRLRLAHLCGGTATVDAVRAALTTIWPGASIAVTLEPPVPGRDAAPTTNGADAVGPLDHQGKASS